MKSRYFDPFWQLNTEVFMRRKRSGIKLSIPPSSCSSDSLTIKAENNQVLAKTFHIKMFWQKIKAWLYPQLIESERLTKDYFEANVHKKQNEADKIAAQAKNIVAQTEVLKQKEVLEFNKIINEIFRDDGLPKAAKYLKLAKVLEKNPHVLEHFKIIGKISEDIELDEQQIIKLND